MCLASTVSQINTWPTLPPSASLEERNSEGFIEPKGEGKAKAQRDIMVVQEPHYREE
jgi:hypothetical protein